jgi:hypothetical protein
VNAGLLIGEWNGAGVKGWLIEAEAGQGGGAISFGRGYASDMQTQAMKLTVLRTWGNPTDGVVPGNTYIGFQQSFSFLIKISVGYMYRIAGPGPGNGLYTFGGGIEVGDLWERGRHAR